MISNGYDLVEKGIFMSIEENWLSASPDGILNGDTVLEIKCPDKVSPVWCVLNRYLTSTACSKADFSGIPPY
jgi:hypothetical protein